MNQCVWFGKICMPYVGYLCIHFSRNTREIKKIPNPKISKGFKHPSENRKKSSKIFRSLTYLNIIFSFLKGQSMAGTQEI